MPDGARTILLAGPSLLYAPVFLAKYCRLSPVFDHLELEWEPELRKVKHGFEPTCSDPVLAALLDKNHHHDVVIAVCDPCRVGYLPDHSQVAEKNRVRHDPLLLGGLIGKVCLDYNIEGDESWPESSEDEKVLTTAHEIVVNDPEMSSFAITAELLMLLCKSKKLPEPPSLFHGVPIGMEGIEARARHIATRFKTDVPNAHPLVYSSSSSPLWKGPGRQRSVRHLKITGTAPNGTEDDLAKATERYSNFLFTGLLTTKDFQRDAPDFLAEVVSAISFAIKVIQADPAAAAKELWNSQDFVSAVGNAIDVQDGSEFLKKMHEENVFFCPEKPAYEDKSEYEKPLTAAIATHKNADWATAKLADSNARPQRYPFREAAVTDLFNAHSPPQLVAVSPVPQPPASGTSPASCDAPQAETNSPGANDGSVENDKTLLSSQHLFRPRSEDKRGFRSSIVLSIVAGIVLLFLLGWLQCGIELTSSYIARLAGYPGAQFAVKIFAADHALPKHEDDLVLKRMLTNKLITQQEFDQIKKDHSEHLWRDRLRRLHERHLVSDVEFNGFVEQEWPWLRCSWPERKFVMNRMFKSGMITEAELDRDVRLPEQLGALVFIIVGLLFLAFIESPRRRSEGERRFRDFVKFVFGMAFILTAIRKLAGNDDTMLSVLFGWGALFYGFMRLAHRGLPNPFRRLEAWFQRLVRVYEFRHALWQAVWQQKYPKMELGVVNADLLKGTSDPAVMRRRFADLETSRWTSFHRGGPMCFTYAGKRVHLAGIRWMLVLAAVWLIMGRGMLPGFALLMLMLFVWLLLPRLRKLMRGSSNPWAVSVLHKWDWVRYRLVKFFVMKRAFREVKQ